MSATSFDRLLGLARLAAARVSEDGLRAKQWSAIVPTERDALVGKVGKSRAHKGAARPSLSRQLDKRTAARRRGRGGGSVRLDQEQSYDARQRAIVKIHYFDHAGGGGKALRAHGAYIARDADRDGRDVEAAASDKEERRDQSRAQAHYLERDQRGVFYDGRDHGIDGAARLENWATSDRRHFRLILSAEEGGRLGDLQAYTREVMARAGAALGAQLSWVAVDHRDTDNPHTHIVVRGRRANGQDLVIPRDFIRHGFRSMARDVATEWLGKRTPEHERDALDREARRHGPTRLDRLIEGQARNGLVRMIELGAPDRDPTMTRALNARVQELARLGLADEAGRGVFRLARDWRERLQAMELHLDIRKRIVLERQQARDQSLGIEKISRGLGR